MQISFFKYHNLINENLTNHFFSIPVYNEYDVLQFIIAIITAQIRVHSIVLP